jgi:hydroxymethylglutaryl-CoA lyase
LSDTIKIVEVGPRDGLQNEPVETSTEWKIELINQLSDTGIKFIETGSFVSPKWVPQMAASAEILHGIKQQNGITYSALTPNLKGFHAALDAGANEVAVFISATEGFSRNNLNCTISQSLDRVAEIVAVADHAKCLVRAYISCITHCPFDGKVAPLHVASLVDRLIQMGCYEISLGDTIGKSKPDDISALLEAVLNKTPARYLAGHFHDTSDNALANVETSLGYGLRTFDASIAGLGGCPFAPGAPGNLDTGKLVKYLTKNGYDTSINLDALETVTSFVNQTIKPRPFQTLE